MGLVYLAIIYQQSSKCSVHIPVPWIQWACKTSYFFCLTINNSVKEFLVRSIRYETLSKLQFESTSVHLHAPMWRFTNCPIPRREVWRTSISGRGSSRRSLRDRPNLVLFLTFCWVQKFLQEKWHHFNNPRPKGGLKRVFEFKAFCVCVCVFCLCFFFVYVCVWLFLRILLKNL